MASNSNKYICPRCFRSVRSTSRDTWIICGYCHVDMVFSRPYKLSDDFHLRKEVNEDAKR